MIDTNEILGTMLDFVETVTHPSDIIYKLRELNVDIQTVDSNGNNTLTPIANLILEYHFSRQVQKLQGEQDVQYQECLVEWLL